MPCLFILKKAYIKSSIAYSFTCGYLISVSIGDFSMPLMACADGNVALLTLVQSSNFGW